MGVGSVFAQQPATDLQLTLIEQPADLEGHRLFLPAESRRVHASSWFPVRARQALQQEVALNSP